MENRITNISIENFKSLKKLEVTNCKRINLFIGKPNVGKSNLLEALSLFQGNHANRDKKYLNDFIRYDNPDGLFYDKNTAENIYVSTNLASIGIRYLYPYSTYDFLFANHRNNIDVKFKESKNNPLYDYGHKANDIDILFNDVSGDFNVSTQNDGKPKSDLNRPINLAIRKYEFKGSNEIGNRFSDYLASPSGNNLFAILYGNKDLKKEVQEIFNEYDLKFALKPNESSIEIFKQVDGNYYSYSYDSTADTIQRFIFHLAAIESNTNSILLFEEPEAHSFPDYIKRLARKIQESETNQFFITTHSPFIINTLLDSCSNNELAIYVMNYENHQSTIRLLSEAEIADMVSDGGELILSSKIV